SAARGARRAHAIGRAAHAIACARASIVGRAREITEVRRRALHLRERGARGAARIGVALELDLFVAAIARKSRALRRWRCGRRGRRRRRRRGLTGRRALRGRGLRGRAAQHVVEPALGLIEGYGGAVRGAPILEDLGLRGRERASAAAAGRSEERGGEERERAA